MQHSPRLSQDSTLFYSKLFFLLWLFLSPLLIPSLLNHEILENVQALSTHSLGNLSHIHDIKWWFISVIMAYTSPQNSSWNSTWPRQKACFYPLPKSLFSRLLISMNNTSQFLKQKFKLHWFFLPLPPISAHSYFLHMSHIHPIPPLTLVQNIIKSCLCYHKNLLTFHFIPKIFHTADTIFFKNVIQCFFIWEDFAPRANVWRYLSCLN